jgi:hypothetical protein
MDGNTQIPCNFTLNELAGLRQIIHVAVQARGMELAEAGVVINQKIAMFVEVAQKNEQRAQSTSAQATPAQDKAPKPVLEESAAA